MTFLFVFKNREALRELSASNDDLTASDDDLSEKSNTKVRGRMKIEMQNRDTNVISCRIH